MADYIWNGVGIVTPDSWEPTAIERDGLTFAENGLPMCEFKWNRVRGSFSFEKHIKKITKGHKGASVSGVSDAETPPAWHDAVKKLTASGFRSHSFIWKIPGVRGIGAVVYHSGTGLAALVQFFIRAASDEDQAAKVLASFREYFGGKSLPWAMFGVTARVPASFVLDTFSFQPGHYRVQYWRPRSGKMADRVPPGKGPGTQLVFERFAPASVLLRSTSLAKWIAETVTDSPDVAVLQTDGHGVRWDAVLKTSLLRTVMRRESFSQGRAWQTDSGNAILSVCASGTDSVPTILFPEICESYALIQEETD
ncbi:hypothetical protein GO013_11660 [Pseudodesulfovibrio sp. JC047]|uniref:hypothetical protein n=1 Tax=Pseudodesulfovibrio sp. JC047 TaxID=2683199 RepID=UPI0013CFB471|nr:hypothetical protein [Pseudodesulfovibrio sp. JC047]NDV20071.1 hypothetical protein [Pseudodesulfovibrio sp. JC047]